MTNIFDAKFMEAVSRNKMVFVLLVFLAGNIYQYQKSISANAKYESDIKELNAQIQAMNQKSLEYEKGRSERMEFLLNNLPAPQKSK